MLHGCDVVVDTLPHQAGPSDVSGVSDDSWLHALAAGARTCPAPTHQTCPNSGVSKPSLDPRK